MNSNYRGVLIVGENILPIKELSMQFMSDSEAHALIRSINAHHFEANPSMPSQGYIDEQKRKRDELVERLKLAGKRVMLVKADSYEECGRYVCEGYDGVNGYDPLPGTVTLEQEV
jgi:hypothetical protein